MELKKEYGCAGQTLTIVLLIAALLQFLFLMACIFQITHFPSADPKNW